MAAEALFLRACRGEVVERTPIWIMRQAGRYLPEYRALRARADFLTCCRTPELACEITLQPVRRLGVDAAILFSDILVPLPAMGVDVAFDPGPRLAAPVRSAAEVAALRVPDAREAATFVLDAVRLVRAELPPAVPLIGFAGAPFTMAAYLVEGGGSKSFEAIRSLLFSEPQTAHALLGCCAATAASLLSEQVRAGAQAAMLFDTWASLLGPQEYRTFALPYVRQVFERVAAVVDPTCPAVPAIYYAGNAAGWIDACRQTGAGVVGVDWRIDLDRAREAIGAGLTLQGNLDPAVLLAPPEVIRHNAARVLGQADGGPHIFNLGHGILQQTPPDHARILVDAVRELSMRRAA